MRRLSRRKSNSWPRTDRSRKPRAPTNRRWTNWTRELSCAKRTWPSAKSRSSSWSSKAGRAAFPPRRRRSSRSRRRSPRSCRRRRRALKPSWRRPRSNWTRPWSMRGIDGTVEQFTLRKGDIVNPLMRPAGILVPSEAGRRGLIAGFGQIEAQVMKVGMIAEVTCVAEALTIIPMVVTQVQDHHCGRPSPADGSADRCPPGGPARNDHRLYGAALSRVGSTSIPPGSQCIANAYTNNHDILSQGNVGTGRWVFLHVVDTVGLVHAMILRMQAILLPLQTLVFSGPLRSRSRACSTLAQERPTRRNGSLRVAPATPSAASAPLQRHADVPGHPAWKVDDLADEFIATIPQVAFPELV